MSENIVLGVLGQQSGKGKVKGYDPLMRRYRCVKENAFTQLLPVTEAEELSRDTPIFACKFATKTGNEYYAALANEDGKLAIHDCKSNERHGIQVHNNAIFDLAWMFENMKLVTASGDHTSKLFDIGESEIKEERVFYGHTRSVKTVAFRSGDSSVFATGGRDGNVILWDTRTETSNYVGKADNVILHAHNTKIITPSKRRKPTTPTSSSGVKSVTGLVFQNDNSLISCGAGDGIIKVWDLRRHYSTYKGIPMPKYVIPYSGSTSKNGFSSLMVDNEGIKLYANCLDNTIYCYNVGTYDTQPIMTYTGHQNTSFYIKSSLSKNGDYIISGSSDENAYVWNIKQTRPLVKLTGHNAEVTSVAWCQSDDYIITCSDDMTHKIWTIGTEDIPEDWDINGKGHAEILPLTDNSEIVIKKRAKRMNLEPIMENTPKKFIGECENCRSAINVLSACENCVTSRKRKATFQESSDDKRSATEFGPRRLFPGNRSQCTEELATSLDSEEQNLKPVNKILDDVKVLDSPTTRHSRNVAPLSPTMNLPNFVVDGTAPHINYSPPKKRAQDWLTKLRIEKSLKREMQEKTMGPQSPKIPRVDTTPTRRTARCTSPKSPLLRFFKVSTSAKCEGHSCSHKLNGCNNLGLSPKSSQ